MSENDIYKKLSSFPCHFTWEELQLRNAGRTVEMNIENLEEHIDQTIQGTEVQSYNLMGFYKTQNKSFIDARKYFNKALEKTKKEDEKIVCFGCLAWLTWIEESSDSSSQEQILERFNQVKRILRGREVKDIPEVMDEKAFSIANSGYSEDGFKEALNCIDRALEVNPDNVMSKFTKVCLMQKLHEVRKKQVDRHGTTVNEIKQLWQDIIKALEDSPGSNVMYAQALVKYALFLGKINREENSASGEEYAEKAKEVASSNYAVMRNVAQFYINAARWQPPLTEEKKAEVISQLENAELILKTIISRQQAEADYKAFLILGQLLLKKYKYKMKPNEETFVEAKHYLRKSWDCNKKYIIPAIDLFYLYREKYSKTKAISALVDAEKFLFREMLSHCEELDDTNKAHCYTTYAQFLQMHGSKLASYHQTTFRGGMTRGVASDNLRQVSKLLSQYTKDRDVTKLLKVEKKFREMYGNLEQFKRPDQAFFHKEYGVFLEKYSKDLAFWYFSESLKHNPHQRRKYTYENLEKLAKEKIASSDREEQSKGHEALEMMKKLRLY